MLARNTAPSATHTRPSWAMCSPDGWSAGMPASSSIERTSAGTTSASSSMRRVTTISCVPTRSAAVGSRDQTDEPVQRCGVATGTAHLDRGAHQFAHLRL